MSNLSSKVPKEGTFHNAEYRDVGIKDSNLISDFFCSSQNPFSDF